jgi:FemAB-related protein (PEP-CTERM system-associated)
MKLTVAELEPNEKGSWDEFVRDQPGATLFHLAGWQRVIAHAYGHRTHYLVARRGTSLCGILPLVEIRSRLFGHSLISVGFFVYGGIVAEDEAARDALAAAAVERGQRLAVGHIELRSECASLADWITKSELYATFRRELAVGENKAMAQVPRKKRADLRKSLNAGLTVESGSDPCAFYAVYAQSVRDLGTPVFPRRLVDAIAQEFAPICELSMVRQREQPLAVLLSFYFRDQVLPYYSGAVPEARALHAYDLLYWSLMRRAVARGARVMDFGRSKRGTGAFAYKTFWGFEPTPLAYQLKLIGAAKTPEVNPLNPKYRRMVAMWQRLPLAVANRLGPMLARQIG